MGALVRKPLQICALVVGMSATAAMVVVGCSSVTEGTAQVDTAEAPVYRASVSASSEESAASSSARESERQSSVTKAAIHSSCEALSSSSVEAITDADFPGKALNASKPVAILFSTPTCPACRIFKPRYEEAAERLEGRAALYEMDITTTGTWRRYDILSVPTVLIFRDGEVTERFTALPPQEDIEKALKA